MMFLTHEEHRKWWILAAMGAILGIILLDETVVGVALHTIQADLDLSDVNAHWVVNIYMLVLAGLAAAAGKFGDIFGHRLVMSAGLVVFGVASLACGFAQSEQWLIVARALQGAGAAIIFPTSLAMATIVFPPEKRGLALGIYGAIGTTFLALGPLVGGLFTDLLSWRWIFWVNPPIVLMVVIIVFAAWQPLPKTEMKERFDVIGLLLLVCGVSMTVFAIMEGPDWGWTNATILSLLLLGIALLVAFVFVELKRNEPLIPVELFLNPTFSGCSLVIFAAQFTKMTVFVFGALYLQEKLDLSPLMTGIALLPTVAPQVFTAPVAGRVSDRFGARWPSILGVAAMLAGLVIVTFAMSSDSYVLMFPGLLVWGLSMAFVFVPPQRAVMNSVSPQQQGEAGGIAMASQLMGATIGMAVCSTLFSMTDSYEMVFLGTCVFTLAVLAVSWLTIERGNMAGARTVEPQQ